MLGRELRDLVFRVCVAAGILLGGLWALHHQYVQPRHQCSGIRASGPAAVRAFGRCLHSDLSGVMMAWAIPICVGALLGTLVGVMLALMIRLGRRPQVAGRVRARLPRA